MRVLRLASALLVARLCAHGVAAAIVDIGARTDDDLGDAGLDTTGPLPFGFPPQFHANFSIAAHLVDRSKPYPPWLRRIEVWYDLPNRKVKAFVHEGFEEGKTFLRRYDAKAEYVLRHDEFAECRRAYLSEPLEAASFPADLAPLTDDAGDGAHPPPPPALLGGRPVRLWWRRDAYQRVKLWVDAEFNLPLSVTDEYNEDGTAYESVMTWTVESIELGPQDPSVFELPDGWTHKRCKRHIGGWPYLHLFHSYLRV